MATFATFNSTAGGGVCRTTLNLVRSIGDQGQGDGSEMSERTMSDELDGLDATEKAGIGATLNRCRALETIFQRAANRRRCPHYRSAQHRRFPEPFVREIEERFGDCLDTDHSAGRGNGMSGIVAGKQPNEAERVHRGERAPRRGLDCRPKVRAEPRR